MRDDVIGDGQSGGPFGARDGDAGKPWMVASQSQLRPGRLVADAPIRQSPR
jgi:hypothetical protein